MTSANIELSEENKSGVSTKLYTGDIKYEGPGLWKSIHIQGYGAKTSKHVENFAIYMQLLCDNFPCNECQTHLQEYLIKNPIRALLNHPGQLFLWTINLHNAVNERIGKSIIPYAEAFAFYKNIGSKEGCMPSEEKNASEAVAAVVVEKEKSKKTTESGGGVLKKINQEYKNILDSAELNSASNSKLIQEMLKE